MTASFHIIASSLLALQPTILSVIEAFIDWSKNKINRKLTSTYMEYTTPAKTTKKWFCVQEKHIEMNRSGVKNTETKFWN